MRKEALHEKLVEGGESWDIEVWILGVGTLAHSLLSSAFAAAILMLATLSRWVVWQGADSSKRLPNIFPLKHSLK
jgi:hypothetical protein